ncbi:MAG: hypothetical protein ACE5FD_05295 [Anaerolineae bacterium]
MRQQADVDPAVMAVLGDASRRGARRQMSKRQRAQARRDARRERITLELDPSIVRMVKSIAGREGVSPAGVCNLLLADAIVRYVAREIEFDNTNTRPSRSPRFEWVVTIDGPAIEQKTGL